MLRTFASLASVAAVALAAPAAVAQDVRATADGVVATTPSIELTLSKGAVTRIVNRVTGEIHTDAYPERAWMPRGVLCGAGGAQNMQAIQLLHADWSSHPLYSGAIGTSLSRVDRMPGPQSVLQCTPIPGGMRCLWTGLTDGVQQFPNDSLTVDVTVDAKTGLVEIAAQARAGESDVVGVIVPIVNLKPRHNLYVPSFGGLVYFPTDLSGGKLCTFGKPPFIEAPALVAEGSQGSVGLWIEDETFRPFFTFIGGDGTSLAMGIEGLNLMPFESKRESRLVRWKVGAFRGTWPSAMRPYRDWYARAFRAEIAQRDAATWADGVQVIVDQVGREPDALDRLAQLLPPARVLIHEWNTRAAGFDQGLPDYAPAGAFVSLVEQAQARGFKAMGYVNSYCANSQSTAYGRDQLAQRALVRPIESVGKYLAARKTFAAAAPGELLYLDPLSPDWRRMHVDAMVRWRAATKADANYEDTAGTAGDFGNGVVGGLAGAEGGAAQFRELLERNPVPMATEYGPDHVGFASRWALRFAQVWGSDEIRRGWETHHRPISPFLFSGGARAWVPTLRAESEQGKRTVVACSDALGGVAQLAATGATFDATGGLARHMVERAQAFSSLGLVPHYDGWPADTNVICQYRDRNGRIYHYRVRDGVQELLPVGGTPLYQRVSGKTEVKSPLRIPNWPAYDANGPIGLNPSATYALTPAQVAQPSVRIDRCPSGAFITRFVDSADFALASFTGTAARSGNRLLGFVAQSDFADVLVTDRQGKVVRRNAPLRTGERFDVSMPEPASMLLLKRPVAKAVVRDVPTPLGTTNGRFVLDASGIDRGGDFVPPHQSTMRLTGAATTTPVRFVAWGEDAEIAFDYLINVPVGSTSVEVEFRNTQTRYGNGCMLRAYVNGALVSTQDLGPTTGADGKPAFDVRAQRWRIPLGAFVDRTVVLTLAVWGKGDDNSDEIWMSAPRIVKDTAQQSLKQAIAVVPN